MSDRFGRPLERHGETPVVLTRQGERLHGTQFFEFPVDIPPVIEAPSVDTRWYRDVWENRGWTVEAEFREMGEMLGVGDAS